MWYDHETKINLVDDGVTHTIGLTISALLSRIYDSGSFRVRCLAHQPNGKDDLDQREPFKALGNPSKKDALQQPQYHDDDPIRDPGSGTILSAGVMISL
jgi:hypothetical protein